MARHRTHHGQRYIDGRLFLLYERHSNAYEPNRRKAKEQAEHVRQRGEWEAVRVVPVGRQFPYEFEGEEHGGDFGIYVFGWKGYQR